MSCSHCGRRISSLSASLVKADGPEPTAYEISVLMLSCPNCKTVIGVVNQPQTER